MTNWRFITLAYMTLFALSIIDNSRGPAYPDIITHFNISSTRGSVMFALATAAGLISSLSAKWWLPRYSLIQASSFSLILLSTGSLFFGASAHLGLFFLDIASIFIGIGMGSSNICMNLLISKGTQQQFRRQFFSGLHSVYGVGSLSAPLLLGLSYSIDRPWYQFFIIISFIPLLTFLWSLTLDQTSGRTQDLHSKTHISHIPFKKRLLIGSIFGLYVACEVLISSRLVYFLELGHNIPIDQARWALSCFFGMLLLGRLLFTIIPFKGESLSWLVLSCVMTLIFFTFSIFFNPLWLIMTGLSMSFFYPVGMDWLSQHYFFELEQLMPSILTFVSLALIAMHMTFGALTDWLSINHAILITYALQGGILTLILGSQKFKLLGN